MERRYSTMAYNADHCKVSMVFNFSRPYPVSLFLQKIDIPKIFYNVEAWQCAIISFRICGIDINNTYIDQVVDIRISLCHLTLKDIAVHIIKEFEKCIIWPIERPDVTQMIVSFSH